MPSFCIPVPEDVRSSSRRSSSQMSIRHRGRQSRRNNDEGGTQAHRLLSSDSSYRNSSDLENPQRRSRFSQPGDAIKLFQKMVRRAITYIHWVASVLNIKENYLEAQLQEFGSVSRLNDDTGDEQRVQFAGRTFNKQDYVPRRERPLSKEAVEVLTCPPQFRTDDDIQLALHSLQTIKSFNEYPLHVQEMLCKAAWYQRVPANKVIIRQGHQGINFYFVISGQAVIKVLQRRSDGSIMNSEKVVFRVERGSSFGDIALLHNVERTATVESTTEVGLLVISRDDFFRIFMQRGSRGIQADHIVFLRSVNALKHWPVEKLSNLDSNCIFHYFKRGKLVVADSLTSDYLYIIKSGTCEVLKQLKSASTRRRKSSRNSSCPKLPFLGKDRWNKGIPVRKTHAVSHDPETTAKQALVDFLLASQDDPNLMVDLPETVRQNLLEIQKEVQRALNNGSSSIAGVVRQMISRKKRVTFRDLGQRRVVTPEQVLKRLATSLKDSSVSSQQTDEADLSKELHQSQSRLSLVKRQNSLAHFNVVMSPGEQKTHAETFKTRLQRMVNRWKTSAASAADDNFKELELAKEIQKDPDLLILQSEDRRSSFSNLPEIEDSALMLSHEGKQQYVQSLHSDPHPTYVRLNLLRPRDVFGLDTLDFDANYKSTEISVCLVSSGAEVFMIKKEFFLANCNSENLEHLRNFVAPYPREATLQDNLQISSDWISYRRQQLKMALSQRKHTYTFA